jgi:hypothetical protein
MSISVELPYVIITGSLTEGVEILGPFPNHDQAREYAEQHCVWQWEIANLYRPLDPAID